MDDHANIETYKQGLRLVYADNVAGLRTLITAMMTEGGAGSAIDSVVINSTSFEGEQSAGQIVFAPMAKLAAALEVLAELDPYNVPTPPASVVFADFRGGYIET